MALIVEDGTGLSNAESYIGVAAALEYFNKFQKTAFKDLPDEFSQEAALRNAFLYMVNTYRFLWSGWRTTLAQAGDWPRTGVYVRDAVSQYGGASMLPTNSVPLDIQYANADFAEIIAGGQELAPDFEQAVLRERIDVIDVTYDPNSTPYKIWRMAAMRVAPYLDSGNAGGGFRKVIRT